MTTLPNIEPSLSDQIVAELLDLLASQPEFEGSVLKDLRLVAAQGRLSNEKEVTNAIKRVDGGTDETH